MTEVRMTSSTGGQKGSKLARYDLLPPEALRAVAELYGRGAEKYAAHNWRRGYDWSLSFAALQRHAWQFWNGEDFDDETGAPHMASVAFHALALITFMSEQRGFDDRPRNEGDACPTKMTLVNSAANETAGAPAESWCLRDGDGDWWASEDGESFTVAIALSRISGIGYIVDRYGIDDGSCRCFAYSEGECACGNWGRS